MPDTRTYPQKARARITGSKIITRLIRHVEGEIELTPAQVASARILLGKVLPDIKVIAVSEHSLIPEASESQRLTDDQLHFLASQARPILEGKVEVVEEPLKLVAE